MGEEQAAHCRPDGAPDTAWLMPLRFEHEEQPPNLPPEGDARFARFLSAPDRYLPAKKSTASTIVVSIITVVIQGVFGAIAEGEPLAFLAGGRAEPLDLQGSGRIGAAPRYARLRFTAGRLAPMLGRPGRGRGSHPMPRPLAAGSDWAGSCRQFALSLPRGRPDQPLGAER